MKRIVVKTQDGSPTLFAPELNENYHSTYGAIQESLHIFISNGFNKIDKRSIKVFEVGLGTGLNAFLTAVESEKTGRNVFYHSIDKYPLDQDSIHSYETQLGTLPLKIELLQKINSSDWERTNKISSLFSIHKSNCDLISYTPQYGPYDLVYFDPFSPEIQNELWSEEIFRNLFQVMSKRAILSTYSAKGSVFRNMKEAGFEVSRVPGPPGKREIIVAVKPDS